MPTIHATSLTRYRHDEPFQPLSCLLFTFDLLDSACTVGMVHHSASRRAYVFLSLCWIAACAVGMVTSFRVTPCLRFSLDLLDCCMRSRHGTSFRVTPCLRFSLALLDCCMRSRHGNIIPRHAVPTILSRSAGCCMQRRRIRNFEPWQARLKKSVAIKA